LPGSSTRPQLRSHDGRFAATVWAGPIVTDLTGAPVDAAIDVDRMEPAEVLDVYVTAGASEAARQSGVSRRTIQRWARQKGLKSGYSPPEPTVAHGTAAQSTRCGCELCAEYLAARNRRWYHRRRLSSVA
jgi:hypothetical protein